MGMLFSKQEIRRIALEQSAADFSCSADYFLESRNVCIPLKKGEKARKYYDDNIAIQFISYGDNVVAAASDELRDLAVEYLGSFGTYECFETPYVTWLEKRLEPLGYRVGYMAEYYLPDVEVFPTLSCAYKMRRMEAEDFRDYYLPEWSNALCEKRKELDILGLGAFEGERLIALAACSADCENMWQIGVDVLPEFRRQGIASALTSGLAREILERGKLPFYCSAWSNVRSVRNAFKSGFVPAWVEMTVKPADFVKRMTG